MKKIVGLIVIALLVSITGAVWAQGGGFGDSGKFNNDFRRGPGKYNQQPGYNQDLNLSEEQLDKMEELHEKYFEKREEIWDQVSEKREELRNQYFNPETSREKIMELQDELDNIRTQLSDLRTQQRLDMREILSTEQLETLSEFDFGPGFGSGLRFNQRSGYDNRNGSENYNNQGRPGRRYNNCQPGRGRGMRSRW